MSQVSTPSSGSSLEEPPNTRTLLKQVREVNWSDRKYIRAGIIPICYQNGVIFFGFGIEGSIAAIGDFGGHRETKDHDALDAAIREYKEEALNVFGVLNRNMLQDYYVLEGKDTAEILLPVPPPFYQYTVNFRNLIGDNTQHEVQSIVWLSRRQLLTAIDSQQASYDGTKIYHMYYRLRDTIHSNRDSL